MNLFRSFRPHHSAVIAPSSRSGRLALACGIVLSAWAGTGLAQPQPSAGVPPDTAPASGAPESIDGTIWQLQDYATGATLKMAVAGQGNGYVAFEDGEFRLNAGCDTLHGSYWLDGDALLFSPHVASTLGDCPPTLRAQEQAVLRLLPDVARHAQQESRLLLLDSAGRPLLSLKAPTASPLQLRRWKLLAYRDREDRIVPALAQPDMTLRFDGASHLSGRACDEYRAGFTREGRSLVIEGPVAGTRFGCPASDAATRQAEDYLRALTQIDSYRVDDSSLLLRDADGRMLARFAAKEPAAAPALEQQQIPGTSPATQPVAGRPFPISPVPETGGDSLLRPPAVPQETPAWDARQ